MSVRVTRMELMRLKRLSELAAKAKSLLEEKRSVLVMELLSYASEARKLQEKAIEVLNEAYEELRIAQLRMGLTTLWINSMGVEGGFSVSESLRIVMGVEVPVIKVDEKPGVSKTPSYSLYTTSSKLDSASEKFKEAVKLLVRLAEVEAVITSLSRELSRIKRRVNALDKVIIPRIKADIAFIEFRLEETEREDLFRIRRIAQRSSG